LYRIVWLVFTNVFEEHTAKIFQVLFLFMTPCCLIKWLPKFWRNIQPPPSTWIQTVIR